MHTQERVAESTPFEINANGTEMYPQEPNQNGTTRHSKHCKGAFGRYDWRCHRCVELMEGRRPRSGWQGEYFRRKLARAQQVLLWDFATPAEKPSLQVQEIWPRKSFGRLF